MKQNLINQVAVNGYDVVEYFVAETKKGNNTISYHYNGGNYYFSSEDNKKKFIAHPDIYLPQYGGFCAIAMGKGKAVNPSPKSFKIQEGKLYLFTRTYCGIIDLQRKWNKDPIGKKIMAYNVWAKLYS